MIQRFFFFFFVFSFVLLFRHWAILEQEKFQLEILSNPTQFDFENPNSVPSQMISNPFEILSNSVVPNRE